MTEGLLFERGLWMGFAIAAPVGPIGVLCIRQTLRQGWLAGLVSGLGAATADAMYGCIAGFGLSAVAQFLVDQQGILRLFGGSFLCYLGVQTFRTAATDQFGDQLGDQFGDQFGPGILPDRPPVPSPKVSQDIQGLEPQENTAANHSPTQSQSSFPRHPLTFLDFIKLYGSTLFLTLTNPTTIFSFMGVFAGLGIIEAGNAANRYQAALVLVLGVFSGSALWWLLLSRGTSLLQRRLKSQHLVWINRMSGVMILGFGTIALSGLFVSGLRD